MRMDTLPVTWLKRGIILYFALLGLAFMFAR